MAKSTIKTNKPVIEAKMQQQLEPITNEYLEGIKEAFKSHFNRDIVLSDKTLQAVIDRAGDAFEDMTEDQKLSFLEKAEQTVKKVSVSDPGLSRLVAKFEADAQAMEDLEGDLDAIMRVAVNRTRLYADFRRIYTKDELDGMPYPGTDKDTPWLGNYKPDTTLKSTNAGEIKVTWTNDFVSTLKRGKYFEERLDDLKKEEAATNSSTFFKGWGNEAILSERARLTKQRNSLRSMVRGAIETHHAFSGISGLPEVTIRWCKTKDDKNFIAMPETCGKAQPVRQVTTSPKNIWIEPKGESENGKVYTVSQLIAFDVQEAARNGGTVAALLATVKKAAKGAAGDGTGDGSEMDIEQAYTAFNRVANYLSKVGNVAQTRLILADPKHEHHKDFCENVFEIGLWIDTVRKQFKKEIAAVTEAKPEQTEAA